MVWDHDKLGSTPRYPTEQQVFSLLLSFSPVVLCAGVLAVLDTSLIKKRSWFNSKSAYATMLVL